ncbi:MAG: hypothetical protein JWM82_1918, partial [Myxococcales bacterium]|nr:hypothetical protein [Myxococcales bacterium]
MDLHTACHGQIDAHFSGRIASREESTMRVHLADCLPCRRRYARRRLVEARLDPKALDAYDRIGRGLGLVR